MYVAQRDYMVEAFSTYRPNDSLAVQELLMTLPRQGVAELLEHPSAVGMGCDVGVQDSAAPDVEDHQDVVRKSQASTLA